MRLHGADYSAKLDELDQLWRDQEARLGAHEPETLAEVNAAASMPHDSETPTVLDAGPRIIAARHELDPVHLNPLEKLAEAAGTLYGTALRDQLRHAIRGLAEHANTADLHLAAAGRLHGQQVDQLTRAVDNLTATVERRDAAIAGLTERLGAAERLGLACANAANVLDLGTAEAAAILDRADARTTLRDVIAILIDARLKAHEAAPADIALVSRHDLAYVLAGRVHPDVVIAVRDDIEALLKPITGPPTPDAEE